MMFPVVGVKVDGVSVVTPDCRIALIEQQLNVIVDYLCHFQGVFVSEAINNISLTN